MTIPDPYTLAWWRTQFRGVMHNLNLVNANVQDLFEQIEQLDKNSQRLEAEMAALRSFVGELLDRIAETEEKVGKVPDRSEGD